MNKVGKRCKVKMKKQKHTQNTPNKMHIPSEAMKVRAGLKAFVEHFKFDRKN